MKPIVIPIYPAPIKKNKKLEAAAKKVVKELEVHFKKDGWDINYSMTVLEVFYNAYGIHLENYLLNALSKKKKYSLVVGSNGRGLLIRKSK